MTEAEITELVDNAYNAMLSAINIRCKTAEEQSRALLEELAPYSDDTGFFDFNLFKAAVLKEHQKNIDAVATFDPKAVCIAVDKQVREKLPQVRVAFSLRERLANERMAPADKFFHDLADRLENVIADALRHPEKAKKDKFNWTKANYSVGFGYEYTQKSYETNFLWFKDPSLATLTCQDVYETSGFKRLAEMCASDRLNMCLGEPIRPNGDGYDDYSESRHQDLSQKFGTELRIYLDLPYAASRYSVSSYEMNNYRKNLSRGRRWCASQEVCGLRQALKAERLAAASQYLSELADVLEARIEKTIETPGAVKETDGKRVVVFEDSSLGFVSAKEALATPGGKKLKEVCLLDMDMNLEVEQTENKGGKVRVFIDVPYPDGSAIKAKRAEQEALQAQKEIEEAKKEAKRNNLGLLRRVFSNDARERHKAFKANAAASLPATKALTI